MPIFKIENKKVKQIKALQFKNERELQNLIEDNLEEIFGIKFIASEFSTGEKHGGRIDTLGLDENNNPVIIEYKWGENDNVINQGLFYLSWLVDHKGDFQILVERKLGSKVKIDWGQPRLILLAASFNKYDKHGINSIAENIELWTYSLYDNGLLAVETEGSTQSGIKKGRKITDIAYEKYDLDYHLNKTSKELRDKFIEIKEKILELPNVSEVLEQRSGITYRTSKSFVRFEFMKSYVQVLLRQPKYDDPKKLIKDITSFEWGYKGMVKLLPNTDINDVFALIKQSYEGTL
jgi:predicted transport protein